MVGCDIFKGDKEIFRLKCVAVCYKSCVFIICFVKSSMERWPGGYFHSYIVYGDVCVSSHVCLDGMFCSMHRELRSS